MSQLIADKLCSQELCTGCFACKQMCAKGAIRLKEAKGFSFPEIDASLCVDCGLCSKACPVLSPKQPSESRNDDESISYAVWNKDTKDRMASSSGGVFSALAEKTLRDGGVVYGAAWDENMRLRHVGIDSIRDLDSVRRSKYVQSNTDEVFLDVKSQLKSGRKVLFCGTPCQLAGLLSFLGNKDFTNLITVGVVCHGVPSQWSFDKYIHEIEEKEKVKVYDCNFRSKDRGWRTGLNLLVFGKNTRGKSVVINKIASENSYFNAFLKQYFLRESCYSCPFKRDKSLRIGDIMLSDAWSLWSSMQVKDVDFGKGISAVVANSEKGHVFLRQCADSLIVKERPYSEFASNSGLRRARKPSNNDLAFEFLKTHTWKETQSKFFPLRLADKVPIYTRLALGENKSILIKRTIRKLMGR